VTDLGGSIDEFDLDWEGGEGVGWWMHTLSDGDLSLSWTHDGTLEEHVILVDDTVMWESTDWGDVLLMWVLLGGGVVLDTSDGSLSDSVDLLVDLSSVIVTEVTSSGDCPLDSRWMPGTDTSDLSETSMGLSWESVDTESLDNTGGTFTSGDGNGIDHLVLGKDGTDGDLLLEVLLGDVIVLIESSDDAFWKLLSPDGGECSEASWGLDVTNHTDDLNWWAFDNSDWLDDILSDRLSTLSLLEGSDDVGHTGFVSHEGSKMDWLRFVINWVSSDGSLMMLGSSFWEVTQMTVSWVLKLSVRHYALSKN